MINYCDECQKVTPSDELKLIYKQRGNESHAMYVCPECAKKHERELELTRQNFQDQFGEKPLMESSKPATDVDIHKIIDDAMEKKDRSVTIFIGKEGTTVSVYPYEDTPREWIPSRIDVTGVCNGYYCPECGALSFSASTYCHMCGEKLKKPN